MPICNKPTNSAGSKGGAEIGNPKSEAAKVKRIREQAYFNSYDFDAIEALSGDEDDDEDGVNDVVKQKLPAKISQKYLKNISSFQHNQHHHLQSATSSLSSSKSESTASSNTSSGRSSLTDINYAYLQHFNAYIANSPATKAQALEKVHQKAQSTIVAMQDSDLSTGMRSSSVIDLREADGQNFLLPRAMLKSQSIASTKSMPLTVIETTTTTTTTKQTAMGTLLPTLPSRISNSFNSSKMPTTAAATTAAAATTGVKRFPIMADKTAATNTAPSLVTNGGNNKKTSTSSNATTTSSVTSIEHDTEQQICDVMVHENSRNTALIKSATGASTLSASASASSTTTESAAERGRTSSHQSQYSTNKSGSSGYYSSNVCSTYSSDDHIYCEPVIDILEMKNNNNNNISNSKVKVNNINSHHQLKNSKINKTVNPAVHRKLDSHEALTISPSCDMKHRESKSLIAHKNNQTANAEETECQKKTIEPFSENLRILEASIENLDRHLKKFPQLSNHERIASFVQIQHPPTHQQLQQTQMELADKLRSCNHLPTIMEGYDPTNQPRPWQEDITDDSLLDIDLDAFLLSNEAKKHKRNHNTLAKVQRIAGIDNPTFLTDEQEENHYKCAKYINSCPEDAYCVESDIMTRTGASSEKSSRMEYCMKRYEDQIHFQNTRELLEDVREKIRLLSRASTNSEQSLNSSLDDNIPKELTGMIKTLKNELESYLNRMNQHSEMEIRQLCSGLVKNHNIVKIKKAFERRNSRASLSTLDSDYDLNTYEAIRDGVLSHNVDAAIMGVPASIREQISSIRCASDPNFKMKRKSLTDIFPTAACYIETVDATKPASVIVENASSQSNLALPLSVQAGTRTQLQRNLSFQQPVLDKLATVATTNSLGIAHSSANQNVHDKASNDDKDSMLEWHRKKPSIWEMYYGTNRLNQSLLGKRSNNTTNNTQAVMSYPSSRPESDFTLDLPRAEQLRIKMEKEKKFRQRCRYITTFLGLVFFLLTVMVVSLVLTRGKRMFGSMI